MLQNSRVDLHIPVNGPDADHLTTDDVQVAITTTEECPALDDAAWKPAGGYDVLGPGRGSARYLIGPGSPHGALTRGRHHVWARADAGREAPVVHGTIYIE